jgi:hypothetical protein
MKKTTAILLLVGFFALFYGCKKSTEESIPPTSLYQKLAGTWGMTTPQGASPAASVVEEDEIAVANKAALTQMDLSLQLNFPSFTITFNVDGNNNPTTYTIGGTATQLIPVSGYWNLDYPFPSTVQNASKIYLYSDAAKTTLVSTLFIQILPSGAAPLLSFKFSHSNQGVPYVSYIYSLYLQTSKK